MSKERGNRKKKKKKKKKKEGKGGGTRVLVDKWCHQNWLVNK